MIAQNTDSTRPMNLRIQTLRAWFHAQDHEQKPALIFDLDGTLANSMGIWRKIDKDFLAEHSLPCDDAYLEMTRVLRLHEAAVYTIERFGLSLEPGEIMQRWREMAYTVYTEEVALKPYALDFLHLMRERGFQMAVCTASERVLVEAFLKKQGIYDFFPVLVCATEHEKGKQEADVWQTTLRRMHVPADHALVFEDTLASLIGAKKAGCRVLVMEDEFAAHEVEELKEAGDFYLRDFGELLDLLR